MVSEALIQLVRACASLAACYMFASLYPEIRQVQRDKATGAMQLLPILSMLANCICWGLYGVIRKDYFPLVATNIVGVGFSLFYTVAYYQNTTTQKRKVRNKICVTTAALALLVLYAFASDEPQQDVQDHVGYVAMGVCAVMFGSPLATVREVIATKNAELMPFPLIIAGFVNCLLWLLYGLILEDSFVIAPNLVNIFLGALQLLLLAVYSKKGKGYDKMDLKKEEDQVPSTEIELKVTSPE